MGRDAPLAVARRADHGGVVGVGRQQPQIPAHLPAPKRLPGAGLEVVLVILAIGRHLARFAARIGHDLLAVGGSGQQQPRQQQAARAGNLPQRTC